MHSWPSRMSLRTRLAPMRPRPIIPSCIRRSLPLHWSAECSRAARSVPQRLLPLPELDPPENARLVVDDGGLGSQVAGDALGVAASEIDLVVEEEGIEGLDGQLDPLVPLLVADALPGG